MNILITTNQSILLFDLQKFSYQIIHTGLGLYFGITKDNINYYIGCRNRLINQKSILEEQCSILVLNKKFKEVTRIYCNLPLKDIHGITFFDNKLFCTNTFYNSILIYCLIQKKWYEWRPEELEYGEDINHINYIKIYNGYIYLSCHNFADSQVNIYEYHTKKLIKSIKIGKHIHDLFLYYNKIFINSSLTGELLYLEDINFKQQICDNNIYYNRGLYLSNKYNIIGLTLINDIEKRDNSDSKLNIYTNTFSLIKQVNIIQQGMILDILEVDKK